MIVRSIVLTLTSAAAVASMSPLMADAQADSWRFVAQHASLADCKNAGRSIVAKGHAREFRCENDYTEKGTPALDLYVR